MWGGIGGCLLCLLGRGTGELDPVVGKCQDTALEVAKHSLRYGKAGAGLGVPGPATWPGPWGFLTLRYPGSVGNLGRAEDRVTELEARQLGTASSPGQAGEKGSSALPQR